MVKLQIKEAQCRFHPCYSEICVCIFHISFVLNQICSCRLSHFVIFLKRWSKSSWGHKNGIFTVCRWCCFCHQMCAVCFRAVVNEFTLIQMGIRLLTQAEKLVVKWSWNMNIMWECVNIVLIWQQFVQWEWCGWSSVIHWDVRTLEMYNFCIKILKLVLL